jgi:hypothetical protein
MKSRILVWLVVVAATVTCRAVEEKPPASEADAKFAQQVSRLVGKLDSDRAADRDAAEKEMLELAGDTTTQTDHFLASLPPDSDQMPLAVRDRLSRIRRQVEDRAAKGATNGTTVTLDAKSMPLAEVFKEIEKQTGNKLVDNREEQSDKLVTITLKDEPFWSALDKILDQVGLGIYSYGGEEALSIVGRSPEEGPRVGQAVYRGPLRFEVLQVEAQRGRRQPKQQSLKLQLEVAWEPRMRPIALSQPAADVEATTDTGEKLTIAQPDAVQDLEVPNGTQAGEIQLPFELPSRDVKKITSFKGQLHALVPGRRAKFQFADVTKSVGKSQGLGGVQVTLDDVRKNGAVYEVHMRFSLEEANGSLQSHRNWVFQNLSYLLDKDGKPIENAGFETTRQGTNDVGVAYLFDVPEGLDGLTWVYETPAAIVDLPVDYELKDIELP